MSSSDRAEIIVIGAGALGLATAAELAARGACPLVLDAGAGPNASAVAAGMLAPAFEAAQEDAPPERAELYRRGRDLWPELAERAGIAIDRGGADWIGPREPLAARMAEMGFTVEPTSMGFTTPDDWALEPEDALARLAAFVREHGGEVRTAKVEALDASEAGVRVHAADTTITGETVVVAAGWAAPRLACEGLRPLFDLITPIKGHILRLEGEGTDVVGRVARAPGVYLAPRAGGLVVGASMQPGRTDLQVEPEVVEGLRAAAVELFPALAGARVAAARVGVRSASPDGLPIAGESTLPGVHLALAPRRNGWLLAPLVARVVAAGILGGSDPTGGALRPDRFHG
jgi:glycine oxidase